MRSLRALALGLALLAGARPAQAQQLHVMRESVLRPASQEDRALVDRVREDLAKVRVAEEAYFATHGTYAPELSELKGVKLASGTSIVVLMSGPMGWKAEATHPSLTGAEVLHVMRMKEGEAGCPMMQGGMGGMGGMQHGMGGGMGGGMMGGAAKADCCAGQGQASPKAPATGQEHQH
jgi:hypothetical protein